MFSFWRKQLGFLITLAMLGASLVPAAHAASAPNIVTYQGRVLNANGVPVSDSSLSMSFALYTAVTGGSCVWSNSSASCATVSTRSVTLTTGLFTENLGDTSNSYAAIGDSIFGDNATLYLEVIIAGETLTPRRLITAAPYALNADTLDGIDSATLQLFETGSSRTFEDDAPTIIGTNAAFTYGSGGVGDLRVADELEVMGDGYVDDDLVVGASTSSTETLAHTTFTLGGDDLFVAGTLGVEGVIYTDGGFTSGTTTTFATGAITTTGTTDLSLAIAGGDLTFAQNTVIGDGGDVLSINSSDWDISTTGDLTGIGIITMNGDLTLSSATTDSPKITFTPATGTSWELYVDDTADDLQIVVNTASTETLDILNGGAGVTNVTIDGDLTISGDDLFMGTNTSGFLLVADGTNFNPVALSSDATISSTGVLTIAANAVVLATDTSGNYVATLADAGGSDFTISGSGSEGAAVTIDIAADAIDFDEMVDAMALDASTSIAQDGAEDFTITNGGTGGTIVNLTSSGDFMVQDNSQVYFTLNDDSTLDLVSTSTTGDVVDVTANSLTTASVLDIDSIHTPTGGGTVSPIDVSLTNAASTSAATFRGFSLALTNNPTVAGNTEYLLNLLNVATSNTTDNAVAAGLRLDNADTSTTGATVITDGILFSVSGAISDGIVDAIDASDTNITNALNIGSNHIVGTTGNIDLTNFDVVGSSGNVTMGGDLTISGDDLFMGTNTSGFLLVADGTNFNPVALSSDATISSTGALTIAANSVALSTDTTGNYVATLADAGGSDFTVSGSGSEGAAVTIDIAADAIDFDEMVDAMALDASTSITGTAGETFTLTRTGSNSSADIVTEDGMSLNWTAGIGDSTTDFYHALEIAVTSANHTAASVISALAIANLVSADADGIENAIMIGSGWNRGICFDCDGSYTPNDIDGGIQWGSDANAVTLYRGDNNVLRTGDNLTVDLDLTISGDDLFMGTNTSGFILVADGTNYNPVALSSDATISSTGALTIAANSVALSTDTTGNYVATLADAGTGDFTIVGSGSEGAAVTIDTADDVLDFAEFEDVLDIDAATDINLGANLFSIDLDSTGDFAVRDGTTNVVLFEDDSTIDVTFPTLGFLTIDASSTANTTTTGVLDFNIAAGNAAVDGINVSLTQNDGAADAVDATALEVLLTGNDATGDMFGMTITGAATTNAAAGTYEALLTLTNNENTAGAVTDAIRITSGASTAASITTGLDFDTTDITTDIELQNDLTISNDDNNDLTFSENGGTLNVDFLEASATYIHFYTASGLVMETDQNLRLDAGDGLPTSLVDGTDIELRPEDDVFVNLSAISAFRVDGASTDSQETGGVLDIDVDTTTASNVGIDLNYQIIDDAAATAETMTGLNILIDQYDISGNTTRGLVIQQRAVTATGSGNALDVGLLIDNADTNAGGVDTAAAMNDAIRIIGSGTGAITTGLDFETTNIVTDIELQNAETISNDTDGTIAFGVGGSAELNLTATSLLPATDSGLDLGTSSSQFADLYLDGGQLFADNAFDIDIDDNTTASFTVSEGSTEYLRFTTTNSGEQGEIGSSTLGKFSITTNNNGVEDFTVTGGMTLTSGATHNSLTVTSSVDTETGVVVAANSLTTGKGLSVSSSSIAMTSGTLLDIDYDATGSLSAKSTTFGEITNGRTNTATSGALSDNYELLKLSRASTQNGVGGAFNSVGSVLYIENVVIATAGTISDQANGVEVVMDSDGTGSGMVITMGVVGSPAANSVNNQGVVIDVNESASADAVFLIRSDADGTPDTEFRIDNDGDFQFDGTSSSPASDVAEVYRSTQVLSPGDVVSLDLSGNLRVRQSTSPYDSKLFGGISTKPAFLMGSDVVGYEVALTGRIPLKISGENGSVAVGDPLTSSSIAGHAMKATEAGMIVGYALEPFTDAGTGMVMAFVSVGWFAGDVLGTDGTSTLMTDNVVVASLGSASAQAPTFGSYGLALRGSAWNGNEAQAVEMMLQNVVESEDAYRLSVRNTSESEVAYITNEGTMKIAGDMVIGGNLYPSDRGTPQTSKYIYYDGSAGAAGDFMRTNAKGWSTGSYDFAEMFASSEALTSGDIVVFTQTGESVQRATGTDGERLAGIVSTRPGFLAGENVAGSFPIALAGRVPTKVSAENGAVAVGDPLTASSSFGVAMKASEAGQVVGYALESYTGSESDNLILAYVNVGYWSGGPQTITIVENRASEMPSAGVQSYEALNMSGNIYLATNSILSIGRLEGIGGLWSVESDGTIRTQASIKTVTESYQGTEVETMAVTSPESVITLTGTSTLVEGKAEVRFEDVLPEFNDVISAIAPVRVIVTPSGPVSLYVSEKDQNHFIVERFVGSADVEFDWMVTGYRKGFEPKEKPEETSDPSVLSDLLVPSQPVLEPVDDTVQEEPATPESPDEPLIDSATDAEGDVPVEPTSVVIETPSTDTPVP